MTGERKPFNERPSLNEAARTTPVLVEVIYLMETRPANMVSLFRARGLPSITSRACDGGSNVTIEMFVPDIKEH